MSRTSKKGNGVHRRISAAVAATVLAIVFLLFNSGCGDVDWPRDAQRAPAHVVDVTAPPHPTATGLAVPASVAWTGELDAALGYVHARTIADVVAYVDARVHADVATYVEAVAAARARAAAAVRPAAPRRAPASPPAPSGGATGACGGATNGADAFINRESGGNPGVYNSGGSGAWGCYQIMPDTWSGAGCNDLGAYGSASAAAQAACASRLPLSAWNASGPT